MGLESYSEPAKPPAERWRETPLFAKLLIVILAVVAAAVAVGCAGGAVKWAAWVLLDWTPGK